MCKPLSPRKLQMLRERCWATFTRPVADTLLRAYQEPHRHYHTLSHICELLRDFDAQTQPWGHPRAVEWAIWFHDAVYETSAETYTRNEETSALWAHQMLTPSRLAGPVLRSWEQDLTSSSP